MEKSRTNVRAFRLNKKLADRSGEGRVSWKFWTLMKEAMKQAPNIVPNVVFSSSVVCLCCLCFPSSLCCMFSRSQCRVLREHPNLTRKRLRCVTIWRRTNRRRTIWRRTIRRRTIWRRRTAPLSAKIPSQNHTLS